MAGDSSSYLQRVLAAVPVVSPSASGPTDAHYVHETKKAYSKGDDFDARISAATEEYLSLNKLQPEFLPNGKSNPEHEGYRSVARRFHVDAGTLRYNVRLVKSGKRRRKVKQSKTLTEIELLALALWILLLARLRFPATKRLILLKAQEIAATVPGRSFKQGLPSDQWWFDFKARFPQIRMRKVRALDKARTDASTRDVLNTFYSDLRWLIDTYGFTAERIWNFDETGLESLGGRSLVAVGDGDAGAVLHSSSSHISLLACVNAAGTARMPPTFLFTGKEGRTPRQDLLPNSPSGWMYMQTGERAMLMATHCCLLAESGYITMTSFMLWLEAFISATRPTAAHPVLLILDNHSSRFNSDMLKAAMDRHVFMLALPPHTTHLLQPLDVSVFGPFKRAAHLEIDRLSLKGQKPLLKHNIGSALKDVWEKAFSPSNIRAGFKASGIWPLNDKAVPDSKLSKTAASVASSSGAMDVDASSGLPPVGPLHLFADGILGPDAAPPVLNVERLQLPAPRADEAKQGFPVPFHQLSAEQRQQAIAAAASPGQTAEERLRLAVNGHLQPISMAALIAGKTVELALMPEHLHGVLTLPYADSRDSSNESKEGKEGKDSKESDGAQAGKGKKGRKKPPRAMLLTSQGFIAMAQERADAKRKQKEAVVQRKKERAERKEAKQRESAEKKAEREKAKEAKRKGAQAKAKAKGKAKSKAKSKAAPKAKGKRKRDESESDEAEDSESTEDASEPETSESSSDSDSRTNDNKFQVGFAIVSLIPEPTDPRPFGVGYVKRDFPNGTKKQTPVPIDVWMPGSCLACSRFLIARV